MSFDHANFWLATAAAAPVITLASVVALGDGLRWSDTTSGPFDVANEVWKEEFGRKWFWTALVTTVTLGLVYISQTFALAIALTALQGSTDPIPTGIIVSAEFVALVLLGLGTATSGDLKAMRRRAESEFDKRA